MMHQKSPLPRSPGERSSCLLLSTKLRIPPVRTKAIPRAALIRHLEDSVARKLTCISAPAGFGKTHLVAQWLEQHPHPAAWLTLSTADNDPTRFFTYMVAAVQQLNPHIGMTVANLARDAELLDCEALAMELINDIASTLDEGVLVLDDYHLISSPQLHHVVDFMVEYQPPQLHLVLLSRVDPPLRLGRLRVQHQLTELRSDDLRFTRDEIEAFCSNTLPARLNSEHISMLEMRTEGWPAGVQLACLALLETDDVATFFEGFNGRHRYVVDYLAEEVLSRQPEEVQDFLCRTAVLDYLTDSLCNAVTGSEHGQEMLDRLAHAGLFLVPLDDHQRWFRYHSLFADFLRSRAEPELREAAHRRAARWYERHGHTSEALQHALAVGDTGTATELIEQNAIALLNCGELSTLIDCIDALPDQTPCSHPWLHVARAWALALTGHFNDAHAHLAASERALEVASQQTTANLAGHISAIRAYTALNLGDFGQAIACAQNALASLPHDSFRIRSFVSWVLGGAHRWTGDMQHAREALQSALSLAYSSDNYHIMVASASELGDVHATGGKLTAAADAYCKLLRSIENYGGVGAKRILFTGYARTRLGAIHLERNQLDEARQHIQAGVQLCKQRGQVDTLIYAQLHMAQLLLAEGNVDGAEEALDNIEKSATDASLWFTSLITACRSDLYLRRGKLDAAARLWTTGSSVSLFDEAELHFEYIPVYLSHVRALLAQGLVDVATEALQRILSLSEGRETDAYTVKTLIMLAAAEQQAGHLEEALRSVERALELAWPEHFVRAFVEEGPTMLQLLTAVQANASSFLSGYIAELIQTLTAEIAQSPRADLVSQCAQTVIDPLTERELEVIKLIAAGLSNQEVAEQLSITVGTTKWHTVNIYTKLDVRNRVQAVSKAESLNLL